MSADRTNKPELIEDERGHDDCFDWLGPVAIKGRVWIDAITHDVLRVDRHIGGPVTVKVSWHLQRRYNFEPWVALERDDMTMRYRTVVFTDPDEVILMPESVESHDRREGRPAVGSARRNLHQLPPVPDDRSHHRARLRSAFPFPQTASHEDERRCHLDERHGEPQQLEREDRFLNRSLFVVERHAVDRRALGVLALRGVGARLPIRGDDDGLRDRFLPA